MNLAAKIILDGDSRGAVAAVSRLKGELSDVRQIASKALALTGISFGTVEIIKMADQYGQLSARLQLATRYTGDYALVQQKLQDTANDTRASLTATIDMYSKLSPALQGLGKNSSQSIDIISTVNKAVALSGTSAESASAGIMQFNQALGSGVLRGEELNSILENTPGLADAIAEGLGKTRGELKKMGADGELTADKIIAALEKVADRVDADFSKMPLSVGQSLTIFSNTITEIIGGAGQATGAMGGLARAIVVVSEGMKDFSNSMQTSGITTFIMESIDGLARVVRITGSYIGAWVAAMRTGREEANAIWKAFFEDAKNILNEPLQRDQNTKAIVASEKETAARRLDIEEKLQTKMAELAKLKSIAEGKVSADILATDSKRTDGQIANAKKLRDALASAWKESVKDAAAAGEEAKKLFEQATDVRQTGASKAASKLRENLTPEQQQASIQSDFNDAATAADQAAGLALIARMQGRIENAAKLTKQAERDAERAASLADQIDDPNAGAAAIEQAADIQARLLEQQAKEKEQEQAALQKQAEETAGQIAKLDEQITALQQKAASLKVEADIAAAQGQLAALQAQLDAMQDKTITVTVQQVNTGGAPLSGTSEGTPVAGFAYGGPLPGRAPHDRADNMLYWGTPGEWVIQRPSVRYYGSAFMAALNAKKLPKYGYGGALGNLRIPSANSLLSAAGHSSGTPIILDLNGRRYPVTASSDVADSLNTAFRREALKRGVRK